MTCLAARRRHWLLVAISAIPACSSAPDEGGSAMPTSASPPASASPSPMQTQGDAGRVATGAAGVTVALPSAGTVARTPSAGVLAPMKPAGSPAPMSTAGEPAGGAGALPSGGAPSVPATETPTEPTPDCTAVMSPMMSGTTPYPGGRWTVPEASFATVIERDIEIKMSDGVVLIGDVSYPADRATGTRASGKFPVLLTQNPYGSGSFGAQYGELFVTHGYIFASIDVRGTNRSGGGAQDLFSPRDADDGAELVAWASKLEGSDGKVGLQGCSQLGINQLETATRLGPDSPVKAMIPACPSGDFYRDTAFDNGIPSITAQALAADAATGGDTAYYREYWKTRDRVARAPLIARANIPALLWSGWHEPGAVGSFELYTVLQNVAAGRDPNAPIKAGDEVSGKYQVIVGDWGHGGGLDLGLQLQWYDTWIKGLDTGLPTTTKSPLHLAELGGTKRWVNARCYPLIERYAPLYLAANKRLARTAGGDESRAELTWVPQARTATPIEYASEPFTAGGMLAGPLTAQLQVTSSNTNVQLYLEVLDRAADGKLAQIAFGSVLGAMRRTDPEKSWHDAEGLPSRPYLALDRSEPMTPNEKSELLVPLGTTVWSIEPGHSIVLRIATHPRNEDCLGVIVPPVGCYPTQPMLDSLEGGKYQILLGGEQGSRLTLPLLDHGALSTTKAQASPTGNADYPLPTGW